MRTEIKTEIHKMEVGECLEGTFHAVMPAPIGKGNVFMIRTPDGTTKTLGNLSVLASKLKVEFIGKRVWITRLADVQGKTQTYQDYKVEVDM